DSRLAVSIRRPKMSAPAATSSRASSGVAASGSATPELRSEEHTSELQSRFELVCRLLLEKKKKLESFHHALRQLCTRSSVERLTLEVATRTLVLRRVVVLAGALLVRFNLSVHDSIVFLSV